MLVHVPQLTGHERHALVAELLVLAHHDTHLTGSGIAPPLLRLFLAQALGTARLPLGVQSPARLDEHLQNLTDSVDQFLGRHGSMLDQASSAALVTFQEALHAEIRAISCARCHGSEPPLCAAVDAVGHGSGARCLQELEEIFIWAIELARALYRRSLPPESFAPPRITLATARGADPPHRIVPDLGCRALCRVDSLGGDEPAAVVELILAVGDLNVHTLRALLYVFLHEVTAHAYQRLDAPRRGSSHLDSFAEGWMDFVARQLLVDVMHAGRTPATVRRTWSSDLIPGLRLCEARQAEPRVRQGYEAASRVLAALTSQTSTPGMGLTLFQRLSCGLNVRAISEADRISLVSRLATQLPPDGEAPSARQESAWSVVHKYLIDNDIDAFVRRVLSLEP